MCESLPAPAPSPPTSRTWTPTLDLFFEPALFEAAVEAAFPGDDGPQSSEATAPAVVLPPALDALAGSPLPDDLLDVSCEAGGSAGGALLAEALVAHPGVDLLTLAPAPGFDLDELDLASVDSLALDTAASSSVASLSPQLLGGAPRPPAKPRRRRTRVRKPMTDSRRKVHNETERRRRGSMRDHIDALRAELQPEVRAEASLILILSRARDTIAALTAEDVELRLALAHARAENARLQAAPALFQ